MKLSDLKTGMRIILRNGEEYIVLKNVITPEGKREDMYVQKNCGFMKQSSYNEDFTTKDSDKSWDIIKVYTQNQGRFLDASVLSCEIEEMDLIWKEDKKEMTIKEIEKELGYSIKIVRER